MTALVTKLFNNLHDDMISGSIIATPCTSDGRKAVIATLKTLKNNEFAQDLINKYNSFGLSTKQWYWAIKIAGESLQPKVKFNENFSRLADFMTKASESLRTPKLTLTVDGEIIKLARTGHTSSRPGVINVTDGRPYGENQWYGRISPDGSFQSGRAYNSKVRALLIALNYDPRSVTAAYGKDSGNCCFCNKELTDGRSKTAGYGKVCANKYNLPWGIPVVV